MPLLWQGYSDCGWESLHHCIGTSEEILGFL
jgi:hypothetical protein